MNPSTFTQDQLLATKLFLPAAPRMVIPRPRLHALLERVSQVSFNAGLSSGRLRQNYPPIHLGPITGSSQHWGLLAVSG